MTTIARIRGAADEFSGHVAVRTDHQVVTYAELFDEVGRAAGALRALGCGRGDIVALCATRSYDTIVAVLAVLEIGAAVAPFDLTNAAVRSRTAMSRLGCRLILADDRNRHAVPNSVALSSLSKSSGKTAHRHSGASPGDLAYIMHTSGTTGLPKAVQVPHNALTARIDSTRRFYPIGVGDVVLHSSSLVFDFSIWEMLAPLCFGAAVAVAPADSEAEPDVLAEFISDHRVTTAHFVPSLLAEFLTVTGGAALNGLRYVFSGGEQLPVELATRLLATTSATVFNQYGPTEACIDVTTARVQPPERGTWQSVVIGPPHHGVTAYALGPDDLPVPDGTPGVLHVGGDCLAWGYAGMGARTAEAFVPDAFSATAGTRLYRTGDRVRRLPDGTFEFLGRADDQIKLNGVRIELSEVESALAGLPGVGRAVAVLSTTSEGRRVIAAHIVGDADPDTLRSALAELLPRAAIPSVFVHHERLPLLPNGKTDRRALAELAVVLPDVTADEPVTSTQERLAAIWREVLGVESVGRSSDFFGLGGQSLLAMRMIARVRAQFGIRIPARRIFDAPTIERFGNVLDAELAAARATPG